MGYRIYAKRELLKLIVSVFYPLGFLTPFMASRKKLLQELWRQQMDWNETLMKSSRTIMV